MHVCYVDIYVAFILSLSYLQLYVRHLCQVELVTVFIWNLSKREYDCVSGCFKIQINPGCQLHLESSKYQIAGHTYEGRSFEVASPTLPLGHTCWWPSTQHTNKEGNFGILSTCSQEHARSSVLLLRHLFFILVLHLFLQETNIGLKTRSSLGSFQDGLQHQTGTTTTRLSAFSVLRQSLVGYSKYSLKTTLINTT